MKNGIFYIALLVVLTACQPSHKNAIDADLTPAEAVFIQSYQHILNEYLQDADDASFHEKLTALILTAPTQSDTPHILQVQSDIQIQLGHFEEAIKLNNALFYLQPNADTRYLNCTLLEVLDRSDKKIEACYSQAAQMYKKALSKLKDTESAEFQDQYFFYLLSMLQAGHPNFHAKIKDFIASLPDEKQQDFNSQYTLVADQHEHADFLDAIRTEQWTRFSSMNNQDI